MLQRIMLKISGEQLGSDEYNFDIRRAENVCQIIESLVGAGYAVACVMGGGNVIRGNKLHSNGFTNEVVADQMGMLATVQNGLFLTEVLRQRETVEPRLLSNIHVETLVENFSYQRASKFLHDGKVVLIAGGLGKPGFTTDTGVVSQAFELHCGTVVKTTKVDGIYDRDPEKFPDAVRYENLSYADAVAKEEIAVMDNAAMAFAGDKGIRIAICKPSSEDVLALLDGDTSRGTLVL